MRTWMGMAGPGIAALLFAALLFAPAARAEQADASAPVGSALPAEHGSAPAPGVPPSPTTWDELPEPPPPPPPPPPAAPPREHWYGWQILLSDAASLTLGVATSETWVAAPGYLLAPPLIHVFHGQGVRALASAGMRVGLPLLGYAIASEGIHGCSDSEPGCGAGMIVVGFIVGISAVGIDPAFAYEPRSPERTGSGFAPQILITDREARFGLVGSF